MAQRSVYLKNAVWLAASGIVLRLLGMGYRVYLSQRLGTEGMGLYQLVLAVYTVFVALASSGLNVASTRLAAQSLARGRGMAATLRSLCGTAAVISPVGLINDHGKEIRFPSGMDEMGPVLTKLYTTLRGIQQCEIEAPEGWILKIQ